MSMFYFSSQSIDGAILLLQIPYERLKKKLDWSTTTLHIQLRKISLFVYCIKYLWVLEIIFDNMRLFLQRRRQILLLLRYHTIALWFFPDAQLWQTTIQPLKQHTRLAWLLWRHKATSIACAAAGFFSCLFELNLFARMDDVHNHRWSDFFQILEKCSGMTCKMHEKSTLVDLRSPSECWTYLDRHSVRICIRSKSRPISWSAHTWQSLSRMCIWEVSRVVSSHHHPVGKRQQTNWLIELFDRKAKLTVLMSVQRPNRAVSPRRMFMITVSAISSALCPVAMQSTSSCLAPRSSACRRNTPQNVQLFVRPISPTMRSIVQP